MKKINLILFALVLLAFSQCKKSKDVEQPQSGKFDVKLVVENGGSKNSVDGYGRITWSMDDKFYFFNNASTSELGVSKIEGTAGTSTHKATLYGTIYVSQHPRFGYPQYAIRDMMYVGSNKTLIDNVLSLSFASQTGLPEDIGKTSVMGAYNRTGKRVQGTNNPEYNFDNSTFTLYNAIARFDLSEYENKNQTLRIYYDYNYSQIDDVVPTKINISAGEVENYLDEDNDNKYCQKVTIQTDIDTGNYIEITEPTGDTYVSLLPHVNNDIAVRPVNLIFKTVNGNNEEVTVGTIQLPNIFSNILYTGPNFAPIKLETGKGTKSVVVATEM